MPSPTVQFRVKGDRYGEYKRQAEEKGLTVNEWARSLCDRALLHEGKGGATRFEGSTRVVMAGGGGGGGGTVSQGPPDPEREPIPEPAISFPARQAPPTELEREAAALEAQEHPRENPFSRKPAAKPVG